MKRGEEKRKDGGMQKGGDGQVEGRGERGRGRGMPQSNHDVRGSKLLSYLDATGHKDIYRLYVTP